MRFTEGLEFLGKGIVEGSGDVFLKLLRLETIRHMTTI